MQVKSEAEGPGSACAWYLWPTDVFLVHEFHEFTRITKRLDNGDLIGRTNFH